MVFIIKLAVLIGLLAIGHLFTKLGSSPAWWVLSLAWDLCWVFVLLRKEAEDANRGGGE